MEYQSGIRLNIHTIVVKSFRTHAFVSESALESKNFDCVRACVLDKGNQFYVYAK